MANDKLMLQQHARALAIMLLPFDCLLDDYNDDAICNTVGLMRKRILQKDYWEPIGGLDTQRQKLNEYLSRCRWLDSQTGEEMSYQMPPELDEMFSLLLKSQASICEFIDGSGMQKLKEITNNHVLPLLRLLGEGKKPVIEKNKTK